MLKVRPPYSLIIAALTAIYMPLLGLIAGAAAEILFCGLLFWKLQSAEEFAYESFYGQLLSQLTIMGEIYIWDIMHLMLARVAAYLIAAGIVYFSYSFWFLLFPLVFFILTITHRD